MSPERSTVKVAFFGPQLVTSVPGTFGQLVEAGDVFVGLDQIQQLVPSIATGSEATIPTIGAWLIGGGGKGGRIVMFTGNETRHALLLSVALAVSA